MSITVVLAVGMNSLLIANSRFILQSAGYVVISTETVREAIDQFKVGDFDLVFTGDSISTEDRVLLEKLVRGCGSHTPVVSVATLFDYCDAFADTTIKSREMSLLQRFGALISEMTNREPVHPSMLRIQSANPGFAEDAAGEVTRRRGPYRDDRIEPDWRASQNCIEEDLRRAPERNELTLHYQPKIDLGTGSVVGAEALCRWTHPTRGSVSPTRFIPIAEQSGQMDGIGAWVLREACTQAKAWMDDGMDPMKVAVNISECQLQNGSFPKELREILTDTGFDPSCLELDVAANILTKHPELMTVLKEVRNFGIHISADNLGIIHTSLSTLRELPLSALKIDRSFIGRITNDREGQSNVKSIIKLGHQMNLRVVAEGVEEARHLEFLWERRCDEAQGYYFGKPVPAAYFALYPNRRVVSA